MCIDHIIVPGEICMLIGRESAELAVWHIISLEIDEITQVGCPDRLARGRIFLESCHKFGVYTHV